jgi:hypothetical protein
MWKYKTNTLEYGVSLSVLSRFFARVDWVRSEFLRMTCKKKSNFSLSSPSYKTVKPKSLLGIDRNMIIWCSSKFLGEDKGMVISIWTLFPDFSHPNHTKLWFMFSHLNFENYHSCRIALSLQKSRPVPSGSHLISLIAVLL